MLMISFADKWKNAMQLPVIIRVMTDEEAIIAMVDSNLQREKISHSEKAYAYMMKNEACANKV